MPRLFAIFFLLLAAGGARAQFVYPRAQDHEHDPGLYTEDPFIVKYRHRFFAVFQGDYKTFYKAYGEISQMVSQNPDDSRAVVWLGNGQTVDAALKLLKGDRKGSLAELAISRVNLNRAVSLRPHDPNIFMMRAATLYVQGQYWKPEDLPPTVWKTLRDDCIHFIAFLGPVKMAKVSIHVRGETYGELGIAYKNLGDTTRAREAFNRVVQLCPNTAYETRAKRELMQLDHPSN